MQSYAKPCSKFGKVEFRLRSTLTIKEGAVLKPHSIFIRLVDLAQSSDCYAYC